MNLINVQDVINDYSCENCDQLRKNLPFLHNPFIVSLLSTENKSKLLKFQLFMMELQCTVGTVSRYVQ